MTPGPSLAGVRLAIADHALGFPVLRTLPWCTCCRHYPGAATGCLVCSLPQSYQPSPIWQSGRPAHRPFRGLFGVHLRYGLHTRAVTIFRDTLTKGFNYFVTSIVAPVASGWSICRVGLSPTGKASPFHGARQNRAMRKANWPQQSGRSYTLPAVIPPARTHPVSTSYRTTPARDRRDAEGCSSLCPEPSAPSLLRGPSARSGRTRHPRICRR